MKIFALADLHLSLAAPFDPEAPAQCHKPMDIFGAHWQGFYHRLAANWRAAVTAEDWVLVAGDISWAQQLSEAADDFAYLGALPGRLLMIKGNHDYWWQSVSQVRAALPANTQVLQHQALAVGDYAVCGSRGWLLPGQTDYQEQEDGKIYRRELLRLEMALEEAVRLARPIIAMLHYPPLTRAGKESGFSELLARYRVQHCIYGHIHQGGGACFQGERNGVQYHHCSVDCLDFRPKLIAVTEPA